MPTHQNDTVDNLCEQMIQGLDDQTNNNTTKTNQILAQSITSATHLANLQADQQQLLSDLHAELGHALSDHTALELKHQLLVDTLDQSDRRRASGLESLEGEELRYKKQLQEVRNNKRLSENQKKASERRINRAINRIQINIKTLKAAKRQQEQANLANLMPSSLLLNIFNEKFYRKLSDYDVNSIKPNKFIRECSRALSVSWWRSTSNSDALFEDKSWFSVPYNAIPWHKHVFFKPTITINDPDRVEETLGAILTELNLHSETLKPEEKYLTLPDNQKKPAP